ASIGCGRASVKKSGTATMSATSRPCTSTDTPSVIERGPASDSLPDRNRTGRGEVVGALATVSSFGARLRPRAACASGTRGAGPALRTAQLLPDVVLLPVAQRGEEGLGEQLVRQGEEVVDLVFEVLAQRADEGGDVFVPRVQAGGRGQVLQPLVFGAHLD